MGHQAQFAASVDAVSYPEYSVRDHSDLDYQLQYATEYYDEGYDMQSVAQVCDTGKYALSETLQATSRQIGLTLISAINTLDRASHYDAKLKLQWPHYDELFHTPNSNNPHFSNPDPVLEDNLMEDPPSIHSATKDTLMNYAPSIDSDVVHFTFEHPNFTLPPRDDPDFYIFESHTRRKYLMKKD